jgi:hypothetical protein
MTQKEKSDYELALKLRRKGVITTPGEPFEESDHIEIKGLNTTRVFKYVEFDTNEHTRRIFNSRLVREIKGKNTVPYEKSRLVIQA